MGCARNAGRDRNGAGATQNRYLHGGNAHRGRPRGGQAPPAIRRGRDPAQSLGGARLRRGSRASEHASALIHTLRFGNRFRKAVGAKSYLSFTNTRGGPNCPVVIPLMHKHDEGMRSHYLTIQFSIVDAPAPDEIVVALGASIGGRPHHRIGDRHQDIRELGGNDV
jgi:hypothetical protein